MDEIFKLPSFTKASYHFWPMNETKENTMPVEHKLLIISLPFLKHGV
jgi:hypothetical protein